MPDPVAPAPATQPAAATAAPAPAAPAANVQPQTAPAAQTPAPSAPAPEQKTLLNTPPAEGKAPEAAKPAEAPKPAEWKLTPIEGSKLPAEHVAATEAWAKKHGLSEAQAREALARDHESLAHTFDVLAEQTTKDPDLGGAKLPETIKTSQRVLATVLTAEERQAIANMPISNHVLFHRFLNKIAALLPTEDVSRKSSGTAPAEPMHPAKAMYPYFYDKK